MSRDHQGQERGQHPSVPVYILSNDVVPGMGMPVSAPGLRSRGLAEGLRHHGLDVTEIVPDGPVNDRWNGSVPPARPAGVTVLAAADVADFLLERTPAIVIAINSNQIERLPIDDRLAIVVDLFAPRILEVACQAEHYPAEQIAAMRRRDILAMERGWSFVVNGPKKVPFYLAWLLQTDRDPSQVPMDVVPMPMARSFANSPAAAGTGGVEPESAIEIVSAGYLQGWSRPGPWYSVVAAVAAEHGARFHVAVVPRKKGGDGLESIDGSVDHFDHPSVVAHGGMLYDDYQRFMCAKDLAVDLFDFTVERPLAMVTRTIGAIAAGLPVIHVPWTETADYIAEFDAGWLVDPRDENRLAQVVDEALGDHELREAKAANARRLWSMVFDPAVATRPLAQQIFQHSAAIAPPLRRATRSAERRSAPAELGAS